MDSHDTDDYEDEGWSEAIDATESLVRRYAWCARILQKLVFFNFLTLRNDLKAILFLQYQKVFKGKGDEKKGKYLQGDNFYFTQNSYS